MSLPRTVADVIASYVTLELDSLDRVYLNVYQPKLQTPWGREKGTSLISTVCEGRSLGDMHVNA
jgi:hypothetical protein